MDVILIKKVANLGNIGDRVKVKAGYGRNFLLPTGRATLATVSNIAKFEAQRAEFEKKAAADLSSAEDRGAALKGFHLTMTAKAGSEGKLFGSIGTSDIAEALTREGHAVERSEVRMPTGPIRMVGEHVLTIHLHTDVNVEVTVTVSGEE
ncbi:MAG TPA: 50S ribosomal protein L9 [Steroidobacteraceae bacterium]|nr:50S ribosomal protein L9 [Steroidobacteraceae bacterium]